MWVLFTIVTILVISLQSLVVFYLLKNKRQADILLAIFCVLLIFDAGLMLIANLSRPGNAYWSTAAPFGLIYGPLLLSIYRSTQDGLFKPGSLTLHFLPALLGLVFYIIILFNGEFRNIYLQQYLIVLFASMSLSWIIYPFLIITNKNRSSLLGFGLFKYGMVLLWVLTSYIVPLIWSSLQSGIKESALTADFVIIGTMLVASMLTYWFFLRKVRNSATTVEVANVVYPPQKLVEQEKAPSPGSNSQSNLKNVPEDIKERIVQSVCDVRYCDPNFNLKQLAKELNLPLTLTSQYFSHIYPDGFVKTINKRRIEKACELLMHDPMQTTIDEMAFLCGFNSRASFYRNFQNEIGCTPSAYREQML
ncbi:Helix-turn-helix domain-containing protein [Sphingobacterium nematocida]|uniref:Helix-turn-helix domain-containing protein n=1 Tax=Sphingobacterium nematocida TaxID=1513896 RepID=A0A1T5BSK1_9SPHI|nr:Helix-turn-helix domain-containing protein [Sphingobacterium nematocida]